MRAEAVWELNKGWIDAEVLFLVEVVVLHFRSMIANVVMGGGVGAGVRMSAEGTLSRCRVMFVPGINPSHHASMVKLVVAL